MVEVLTPAQVCGINNEIKNNSGYFRGNQFYSSKRYFFIFLIICILPIMQEIIEIFIKKWHGLWTCNIEKFHQSFK